MHKLRGSVTSHPASENCVVSLKNKSSLTQCCCSKNEAVCCESVLVWNSRTTRLNIYRNQIKYAQSTVGESDTTAVPESSLPAVLCVCVWLNLELEYEVKWLMLDSLSFMFESIFSFCLYQCVCVRDRVSDLGCCVPERRTLFLSETPHGLTPRPFPSLTVKAAMTSEMEVIQRQKQRERETIRLEEQFC